MNKTVIVVASILEALVVLVAGLAISFVPLTIMWFGHMGNASYEIYWRAASDIWLLGHGVDFSMTLPASFVVPGSLPNILTPFVVSIAPLAFALLTFLLAVRLGRRTIEAGTRYIGPITAITTFAAANLLIVLFAITPGAMPDLFRAFVLPPLIFALGVVVGARGEIGRSGGRAEKVQERVTRWARALDSHWQSALVLGARGAAGFFATLTGIAAVLLAILILVDFPRMVALYEGLQAGIGGSAVLTLAQMVLMPNFVLWVVSWLTGAGFAIGVGSSVSPLATQLGPLPSLPIFGIIPSGNIAGGYAWLVIPVVVALLWAIAMRRQLVVRMGGPFVGGWAIISAIVMTLMATVFAFLLALIASGAGGPGRLSLVGIVPWQMALWVFFEVALGSAVGWLIPLRARAESKVH